jgi:hypothetical protein
MDHRTTGSLFPMESWSVYTTSQKLVSKTQLRNDVWASVAPSNTMLSKLFGLFDTLDLENKIFFNIGYEF